MSATILETQRLRLRRHKLDDEAALYEVFGDPEAHGFYPRWRSASAYAPGSNGTSATTNRTEFGLWALELKDSGRFMGDCGLP